MGTRVARGFGVKTLHPNNVVPLHNRPLLKNMHPQGTQFLVTKLNFSPILKRNTNNRRNKKVPHIQQDLLWLTIFDIFGKLMPKKVVGKFIPFHSVLLRASQPTSPRSQRLGHKGSTQNSPQKMSMWMPTKFGFLRAVCGVFWRNACVSIHNKNPLL